MTKDVNEGIGDWLMVDLQTLFYAKNEDYLKAYLRHSPSKWKWKTTPGDLDQKISFFAGEAANMQQKARGQCDLRLSHVFDQIRGCLTLLMLIFLAYAVTFRTESFN